MAAYKRKAELYYAELFLDDPQRAAAEASKTLEQAEVNTRFSASTFSYWYPQQLSHQYETARQATRRSQAIDQWNDRQLASATASTRLAVVRLFHEGCLPIELLWNERVLESAPRGLLLHVGHVSLFV